ncbi:MAG: AI-2E family transporter [SAR202 cluster bacterium]|nr:AI-2E family transporter [SAR202 cluster bacterium]
MESNKLFRAAIILIAFSAAVFLVGALGRLWHFMADLFIILFFAWLVGSLLTSAVEGLMRVPLMPRWFAILFVYALLVGTLAVFAVLVLPATVKQLNELTAVLPAYINRIPVFIADVETLLARVGIDLDLDRLYQLDFPLITLQITTFIQSNAPRILQWVLSALFAVSSIVVLSFYIVLDGGRRFKAAAQVLPPAAEREARLVIGTIKETFRGYVRGMLIVSTIYGIATVTVMSATGLPAALPTSIISALLLAVPFVGDWLALMMPVTIAALSGDPVKFFFVLGSLVFVNQVMLNLITPRILGNSVRMPAMLVIVSVWFGVKITGIGGALFGVPAGAVLYSLAVVYGRRIKERREAREREATAKLLAEEASMNEAQ